MWGKVCAAWAWWPELRGPRTGVGHERERRGRAGRQGQLWVGGRVLKATRGIDRVGKSWSGGVT